MILFPIVTFPYLSRTFGPENYGKINFALAINSFFITASSLGIPLFAARTASILKSQPNDLVKFSKEITLIHLLSSIIAIFLYATLPHFLNLFGVTIDFYWVLALQVPLAVFTFDWLFQGQENFRFLAFRTFLIQLILIFLLFSTISKESKINDYFILIFIASAIAAIISIFMVREMIFIRINSPYSLIKHFNNIINNSSLTLSISLYVNLDVLILGILSSQYQVGYYTIVSKIYRLLLMLTSSIGNVLQPRLSQLAHCRNENEFQDTIKRLIEITLLICIPLFCFFLIYSEEIIKLIAGNSYAESKLVSVVLSPVLILIGLTSIFGFQVLYPLGKERLVLRSIFIGASTSILVNLILTPRHGAVGAAWATVVAELIVFLIQLYYINKTNLNIWPTKNISKIFAASIFAILISHTCNFIALSASSATITKMFVGFISYFIALHILKESLFCDIFSSLRKMLMFRQY